MLFLALSLLGACTNAPAPTTQTAELTIYDWPDDIPPAVLNAFTAEYGIKITYLTYPSQEEAAQNIQAGVVYDAVVLENQLIPPLIKAQLLADIDIQDIPNFKNISPNFRDLASDPNNQHTVPFTWGTTGILVRNDLVKQPITRWADLWTIAQANRTVLWRLQRYVVGLTLKMMGSSINSEDPTVLNRALPFMLELKKKACTLAYDPDHSGELLAQNQVAVMFGWASDVLHARATGKSVAYILPQEGTILWGDNWVIPANSLHKAAAKLFLNFILRPEIDAQIVNHNYYATPNEAARALVEPSILQNPVIFPPQSALANAETILPLSPQGQQLYEAIWTRFLAAKPASTTAPQASFSCLAGHTDEPKSNSK